MKQLQDYIFAPRISCRQWCLLFVNFVFSAITLSAHATDLPPVSNIIIDPLEPPQQNEEYVAVLNVTLNNIPDILIMRAKNLNFDTKNIIATATFQDTMNSTGWGHLKINIPELHHVTDTYKAYAAGVLEGYLTWHRIHDFFLNTRGLIAAMPGGSEALQSVLQLMHRSVTRMQSVSSWNKESPLSSVEPHNKMDRQVYLTTFQIWGLSDGYESSRTNLLWGHASWPRIDVFDMHLLSADGDYEALKDAVRFNKQNDGNTYIKQNDRLHILENDKINSFIRFRNTKFRKKPCNHNPITRRHFSRCSALVRLANDSSDLFVGHTTWEPYSEMTRILKFYDFPYRDVSAKTLAFSSYPGAVTSTDDFILTSSKLAITETTIDMHDRDLFQQKSRTWSQENTYADFMKPLVASRLSLSGREWVQLFKSNSEAFHEVSSNQWMIVDYNMFRPKIKPKKTDGLLFIIEQVPGLIHDIDASEILSEQGYWGSANKASLPLIQAYIGERQDISSITAPTTSHFPNENLSERSFTFSRLAPHVNTLNEMKQLMQFSSMNDKKRRHPNPNYSIAPRFDLTRVNATPEGATDSKVVDATLMQELSFIGISGPEHQQSKFFQWDTLGKLNMSQWPHAGLPNVWNFTWELVRPDGLQTLMTNSIAKSQTLESDWENELMQAINDNFNLNNRTSLLVTV